MRPRDKVNEGFDPTMQVFSGRYHNLLEMAYTAYDFAGGLDDTSAQDAISEGEADLTRIFRQCEGLVALWPMREREFVSQAYGLLEQQIRLILKWHDDAIKSVDYYDEYDQALKELTRGNL